MSFSLRPYQQDIIAKARGWLRAGERTLLIQSPTGSGKTVLIAHMLGRASSRGNQCWFVVHRRELIKQSAKTFDLVGIPYGVVAAGFAPNPDMPVQICSVQTLVRRFHNMAAPDLIVWDEAHHNAANSWDKVYSAFSGAIHIGLTATPVRMDGTGLRKWFNQMVEGPTVEWLIENGWLSPYHLYAPGGGIDMTGVHSRMGDYVKREMVEMVDRPSITGDAVSHYLKLAKGRRAVVFCASIEHSLHVVAAFREAGVTAEHIDGETPHVERDAALARFSGGETDVISNVDLIGEGFDCPMIACAILLRPTRSLCIYLQQCGRSLRISEGKENTIILDHAGNCKIHGLPDDLRKFDLDGAPTTQRKGDTAAPVRVCKTCFGANPSARKKCQFCGYEFPVQPREIEEREGTLSLVEKERVRTEQRASQGRCRNFDDLVAEGKKRGMKNPYGWAHYVSRARQSKRFKKAAKMAGKWNG